MTSLPESSRPAGKFCSTKRQKQQNTLKSHNARHRCGRCQSLMQAKSALSAVRCWGNDFRGMFLGAFFCTSLIKTHCRLLLGFLGTMSSLSHDLDSRKFCRRNTAEFQYSLPDGETQRGESIAAKTASRFLQERPDRIWQHRHRHRHSNPSRG